MKELKFTAAARARFTLYLRFFRPRGDIKVHSRRPCPVHTVLASMWSKSPVDVDVSIIDKTATLLSFMDPLVSLPLYGLASIYMVYVSSQCGCLHHQQDGHPPLIHGPVGLVDVVRSCFHTCCLCLSRLCGCRHHRQDGHPPLVNGPAGLVHRLFDLVVPHSLAAAARILFSLRVNGWMDGLMVVCCCCCCQQGISRYLPSLA
jgi:hypothetical protein